MPAGSRRDPALDGLRGVAILLVFLFHYGGGLQSARPALRLFGYLSQAGWVGVELFFALSGFLITGLLWSAQREPHAVYRFYLRRILRIFPLYYTVLAVVFVLCLAHGSTFGDLHGLLVYAGFTQDLPGFQLQAAAAPSPLPLYHLWSLAVEEHFYLLWPLLLLPVRRLRSGLWLAAAIALISQLFRIVASLYSSPDGLWAEPALYAFPLTHATAIAAGAFLALAQRRAALLPHAGAPAVFRWAMPVFVISLACYLLLGWGAGTLALTGRLPFALGLTAVSLAAAATVPLALREGWTRRFLSVPPLRFMGRISFGFYVFHILLQPLFDHVGELLAHSANGNRYHALRLVAAFGGTLLAAWASFHLLESPFLEMGCRLPRQRALARRP